jgi:hypothetical protein
MVVVSAKKDLTENTVRKNLVKMTAMVMEDVSMELACVIKDGKTQTVVKDM